MAKRTKSLATKGFKGYNPNRKRKVSEAKSLGAKYPGGGSVKLSEKKFPFTRVQH